VCAPCSSPPTALITTLGRALAEGRLKVLTDLRWDWLSADLPPGCQSGLPAGVTALRARLDHHHQQPESRCVERGVRRRSNRQRGPRPAAAPFDHREHQRRKLQTQGETQGPAAQTQDRLPTARIESRPRLRNLTRSGEGPPPGAPPRHDGNGSQTWCRSRHLNPERGISADNRVTFE